jgi:hypothetical protein
MRPVSAANSDEHVTTASLGSSLIPRLSSRFMAAWRGLAPQASLFYLAVTAQVPPADSIGDAQLRALWP